MGGRGKRGGSAELAVEAGFNWEAMGVAGLPSTTVVALFKIRVVWVRWK